MDRTPDLDEATADRLLDGDVPVHDVPAGWEEVAALLRAAADPGPGEPPSRELLADLVAAARGAVPIRRRRRVGTAAGVALAVAVVGGTGAAAAAGELPGPVQEAVHDVVGAVGLGELVPAANPPGPPSTSGSQDGPGHGRSDEAPGRPADPGPPTTNDVPGRSEEAPGAPDVQPAPAGPPISIPGLGDPAGRGQSDHAREERGRP